MPPATIAPSVPIATEIPTKPAVSATLTMLDWSGYELPEFWSDFAGKYPQVKVEFSFMADSGGSYAKVQSGFLADLIHPCSNFWKIMVDEGLVMPLDTTKISNWKNVNPVLAMIDAYLAPASQAKLANDYGYDIVNKTAIPLVDANTVKLLALEHQNTISRTVFYKYITAEQRDAWPNTWSEVKTSK